MNICAGCKKEVETGGRVSRKSTCPNCGADLHICLNCGFYSETSHNKCIEPKAEFQRTRDRANFCDYFRYRSGGQAGGASGDEKEEAKRRLDELFK